MSREMYASLSGAMTAWSALDSVANNLANASTTGFRASRVSFALEGEPGLASVYAVPGAIAYDTADGALLQDGVPSHLAIRGDGFFALEDGSYTRDGSFRMDAEGHLVTAEGVALSGEGGPIQLSPTESFSVSADGVVSGSTSGEVGKIALFHLTDPQPLGGSRWSGTPTPVEEGRMVQGATEGSNADPMRGMVELMEASRFFESQQKAIQASDDLRSRLNQIGVS
jgi:flagellar basal-body rod protein FlgF